LFAKGFVVKDIQTTVVDNQEMSNGYFRMKILAPGFAGMVQPGQFVMVKVRSFHDPFLRRPFCVFRVGSLPPLSEGLPVREFIELVFKVVGKGTEILAALQAGDQVAVLGPLGHGFDLESIDGDLLLVAGGIGIAPLYMLGETCAGSNRVRLLLGGRTREDILAVTDFDRLGIETYVSTDDGTLGEKGLVTAVLADILAKRAPSAVAACGPMGMICAVYRLCHAHQVPLQVSLEALMACGVGACLGCTVKGAGHSEADPRLLTVCKNGPVFHDRDLDWTQFT
jgi:dihydroorotate dehydrogenase electron transfer subunit